MLLAADLTSLPAIVSLTFEIGVATFKRSPFNPPSIPPISTHQQQQKSTEIPAKLSKQLTTTHATQQQHVAAGFLICVARAASESAIKPQLLGLLKVQATTATHRAAHQQHAAYSMRHGGNMQHATCDNYQLQLSCLKTYYRFTHTHTLSLIL